MAYYINTNVVQNLIFDITFRTLKLIEIIVNNVFGNKNQFCHLILFTEFQNRAARYHRPHIHVLPGYKNKPGGKIDAEPK